MEKIREDFINTENDMDSYIAIGWFIKEYPTEKGYRIELFVSPKFVCITVYKAKEVKIYGKNL